MLLLKGPGWRDSPVVKCSCRGLRFCSNIHMVAHNCSSRGSDVLFWPSWAPTQTLCPFIHSNIHIYTYNLKIFLKRSLHAYTNQLLSHSKSLGNECQTGKGGQNSRQNAIICIKREIHIHIYLYMDRASLKTCGQHWMRTEYRIFCYNLHFVYNHLNN